MKPYLLILALLLTGCTRIYYINCDENGFLNMEHGYGYTTPSRIQTNSKDEYKEPWIVDDSWTNLKDNSGFIEGNLDD